MTSRPDSFSELLRQLQGGADFPTLRASLSIAFSGTVKLPSLKLRYEEAGNFFTANFIRLARDQSGGCRLETEDGEFIPLDWITDPYLPQLIKALAQPSKKPSPKKGARAVPKLSLRDDSLFLAAQAGDINATLTLGNRFLSGEGDWTPDEFCEFLTVLVNMGAGTQDPQDKSEVLFLLGRLFIFARFEQYQHIQKGLECIGEAALKNPDAEAFLSLWEIFKTETLLPGNYALRALQGDSAGAYALLYLIDSGSGLITGNHVNKRPHLLHLASQNGLIEEMNLLEDEEMTKYSL